MGRERARYEASVVTFDQIMERSQQRFWGLERPWKTIATINLSSKRKGDLYTVVAEEEKDDDEKKKRRRKRPGKKMRIKQRTRAKAMKEKKEAEEKAKLEKEEHLKAKKRRLNHVKKLRARAKAKEKKQAARDAAGATGDGGHDGEKEDSPAASDTHSDGD